MNEWTNVGIVELIREPFDKPLSGQNRYFAHYLRPRYARDTHHNRNVDRDVGRCTNERMNVQQPFERSESLTQKTHHNWDVNEVDI